MCRFRGKASFLDTLCIHRRSTFARLCANARHWMSGEHTFSATVHSKGPETRRALANQRTGRPFHRCTVAGASSPHVQFPVHTLQLVGPRPNRHASVSISLPLTQKRPISRAHRHVFRTVGVSVRLLEPSPRLTGPVAFTPLDPLLGTHSAHRTAAPKPFFARTCRRGRRQPGASTPHHLRTRANAPRKPPAAPATSPPRPSLLPVCAGRTTTAEP